MAGVRADGTTWCTLDSRSGETFPRRLESREYAVANSTAYSLYQLGISRNWGRQSETQLSRVRLLTTDEDALIGTPVPVSRVRASSEHARAGEVAANVLRTGAGKWLAPDREAWLEFTLPEPAAVTAYTLTSANDHCVRDPKDWVLQGSRDGHTWVTLDERVGEMLARRCATLSPEVEGPVVGRLGGPALLPPGVPFPGLSPPTARRRPQRRREFASWPRMLEYLLRTAGG